MNGMIIAFLRHPSPLFVMHHFQAPDKSFPIILENTVNPKDDGRWFYGLQESNVQQELLSDGTMIDENDTAQTLMTTQMF